MALKIRLTRHGRKSYAYYHIVVADSRSPRDGRFVERIGSYNPNTNPATIELEFDKALTWLQNGAQPSDTCRLILSYTGVLMKKHLLEGVAKGAFDANEAELRFEKWMKEKASKVADKVEKLSSEKMAGEKEKHAAEVKIKEDRSQALARKYAEVAAAQRAADEAANATEEVAEVAEEAAPAAEEVAEVTPVEVVEEVAPVEAVEEAAPVAEEVVEVAEEAAPVAEEVAEVTPVEEASTEVADETTTPEKE